MGARHEAPTWLEAIRAQEQERHDAYWRGYRHGRRAAEHTDGYERTLWAELDLVQARSTARAFTLGELRGYRQASR